MRHHIGFTIVLVLIAYVVGAKYPMFAQKVGAA